ncbi:MAG: hypothetical protein HRU15_03970 [Planctomycetes bacterium]|nr:hypothetical protein [Planctomycetota bacterium]
MGIILCLLLTPLCAEASIAGVPDHMFPGFLRSWGVAMSNDSTVYAAADRYRKHDDFRTSAFSAYARFADDYIAVIDYSILTDKSANRRSDEITVSFARQYVPAAYAEKLQIHFGMAARLADNYGGESVQNAFHTITSGINVEMPYADSAYSALMYGRMHWIQNLSTQWDYEFRSAAALTSDALFEYDVLVRSNVSLATDLSSSAGVRWRIADGQANTLVAEEVLRREHGVWIACGIHYQSLALSIEHHVQESRTQTMISYAVELN